MLLLMVHVDSKRLLVAFLANLTNKLLFIHITVHGFELTTMGM